MNVSLDNRRNSDAVRVPALGASMRGTLAGIQGLSREQIGRRLEDPALTADPLALHLAGGHAD